MSLPRRTFFLLALAFLWGGAAATIGAAEPPSEQSIRAAMVFNILKFTGFPRESPADGERPHLCHLVRDPAQAEALESLNGRKAGGREWRVGEFNALAGACQVVYVDSRQRWNALAGHPALQRALSIGAYPGFAREGGMIEIEVRGEGIRFDVNLAEGRRAGLHFSPQMLRLARRVHE